MKTPRAARRPLVLDHASLDSALPRRHHNLQGPGSSHPHRSPRHRNPQRVRRALFAPPEQRNKKADQRKRWSAPLPRPNNTDQWILTKGDNNPVDDVGLYRGMRYLKRSHLVGKVQACVPISVLRNERHLADDARRSFSLFWPNQLRPLRRLRHDSHGARGGPSVPFPFLGENPLLRAHSFHSSVFGEKRMRKR